MAKAWTAQRREQIEKFGQRKAPWYCFWTTPAGQLRKKSCGSGSDGKAIASRMANELNADLIMGRTPRAQRETPTWSVFVNSYDEQHLKGLSSRSRERSLSILRMFGREMRLEGSPISEIRVDAIRRYVGKRRVAPGKKPGSVMSAHSINLELRVLKAALQWAERGELIDRAPQVEMLDPAKVEKRYIPNEHLKLIWESCDAATRPSNNAAEWWRALLAFLSVTGWRISEALALQWRDINVQESLATTKAKSNKAKRDDTVWIHAAAMDRMVAVRQTADPAEFVFHWDDALGALYDQFHAIQRAAGIKLDCCIQREHTCTETCSVYGFHDARRSFATRNAGRLTRDELRTLMRHQSDQTTEGYIIYSGRVQPKRLDIDVPTVLALPGDIPPEAGQAV